MIRTYCSDDKAGAFCLWPSPTPYLRTAEEPRPNGAYYRKEPADDPAMYIIPESVGTTIRLREMNGYDDSDFYALYYDATKGTFEEYMYATTRGWSYTACAVVDATPEVLALYKAHVRKQERDRKARDLRFARKSQATWAAKCGISRTQVRELEQTFRRDSDTLAAVLKLLATRKFRSPFRESLANQVRSWLTGERKFATPLSAKQLQYLN
jgi:hypothetical protein